MNEDIFGATFNHEGDKKYRYKLWRIWDKSKPMVAFVGLNPSTADDKNNDPTINKVIKVARHNGYGGVYMINCFPIVSADPAVLPGYIDNGGAESNSTRENNWWHIEEVAGLCKDIVFAWGNFEIVAKSGVGNRLKAKYPRAMALHINKNGSPKHPLYCLDVTQLIPFG